MGPAQYLDKMSVRFVWCLAYTSTAKAGPGALPLAGLLPPPKRGPKFSGEVPSLSDENDQDADGCDVSFLLRKWPATLRTHALNSSSGISFFLALQRQQHEAAFPIE